WRAAIEVRRPAWQRWPLGLQHEHRRPEAQHGMRHLPVRPRATDALDGAKRLTTEIDLGLDIAADESGNDRRSSGGKPFVLGRHAPFSDVMMTHRSPSSLVEMGTIRTSQSSRT